MTIKNTATAQWKGGLKDGGGSLSTGSGTLKDVSYDFRKRFEGADGTNPEELIGAAHAGCFSMAFSLVLGEAGYTADSIDTEATVTLDPDSLSVTAVHLVTRGKVPGADQAAFEEAANGAKDNCPISKLLNAEITLDATLEG
ncbi:OsmC family protein [Halomonas saccharevitans]|uniref:Osmotically inducible protein OsmC n=1 Tax=Halomonas saccharevitans TaxID=416872 RepID=A0A1I7CHL0_9GAMM|nr:OsmC family protein [Halomonas saccharevitans]SFT98882.1 osmotically inducible protein OsmC [Halomonas saccharevitans]